MDLCTLTSSTHELSRKTWSWQLPPNLITGCKSAPKLFNASWQLAHYENGRQQLRKKRWGVFLKSEFSERTLTTTALGFILEKKAKFQSQFQLGKLHASLFSNRLTSWSFVTVSNFCTPWHWQSVSGFQPFFLFWFNEIASAWSELRLDSEQRKEFARSIQCKSKILTTVRSFVLLTLRTQTQDKYWSTGNSTTNTRNPVPIRS